LDSNFFLKKKQIFIILQNAVHLKFSYGMKAEAATQHG